MFDFNQALSIDYSSHVLYIILGVVIIRLTRIRKPKIRFLPSKENLKFFGVLAVFFLLIEIFTTEFGSMSIYSWVSIYGILPVALRFVFEGFFVGWTEEYLFRGAIQTALNRRFSSITVIKIRQGTIITSLIFGFAHSINILLGQPIDTTIIQITFATFFGLVVGTYYDKTYDLSGAAWIHNIVDFTGMAFQFIPI
ncbi:MAG: CPBP family intramembrane metalloprotease [Thermoplasmatales archaeon]|nr:CPBP family intramembrane metalloprotease [Thermoplasmatales archaeon]